MPGGGPAPRVAFRDSMCSSVEAGVSKPGLFIAFVLRRPAGRNLCACHIRKMVFHPLGGAQSVTAAAVQETCRAPFATQLRRVTLHRDYEEIQDLLARGDESYGQFIDAFQRKLPKLVKRLIWSEDLNNEEIVEAVVAEITDKLGTLLNQYRGDGPFQSTIMSAADNILRRIVQEREGKRINRGRATRAQRGKQLQQVQNKRAIYDKLRPFVGQLRDERARRLIVAFYLDNEKQSVTGSELGLSPANARKIRRLAYLELLKIYERMRGGDSAGNEVTNTPHSGPETEGGAT